MLLYGCQASPVLVKQYMYLERAHQLLSWRSIMAHRLCYLVLNVL